MGKCKCNVNNKFIERTGTEVSSALGRHLQYCANRNVFIFQLFNWRIKLSIESSGSCRNIGKLFQMVGPATANERGPEVDDLTGETISWKNIFFECIGVLYELH